MECKKIESNETVQFNSSTHHSTGTATCLSDVGVTLMLAAQPSILDF